METVEMIPDGRCNSVAVSGECDAPVNPVSKKAGNGKSVEYAPDATTLHWFPIRATYHRAQKVYDRLVELNDGRYEPYLPTLCSIECADGVDQ